MGVTWAEKGALEEKLQLLSQSLDLIWNVKDQSQSHDSSPFKKKNTFNCIQRWVHSNVPTSVYLSLLDSGLSFPFASSGSTLVNSFHGEERPVLNGQFWYLTKFKFFPFISRTAVATKAATVSRGNHVKSPHATDTLWFFFCFFPCWFPYNLWPKWLGKDDLMWNGLWHFGWILQVEI